MSTPDPTSPFPAFLQRLWGSLATVNLRDRLTRLLIGLTTFAICLLLFALWQGRDTMTIANDINRCGSLRYRSLYIFGAVNMKGVQDRVEATQGLPDWPIVLTEMEQIREDLRTRYPTEIQATDTTFKTFRNSLKQRGTVGWATTNGVREQANTLTNTIEAQVHRRIIYISVLYVIGIVGIGFALPGGVLLAHRLREAQQQLASEQVRLAEENAEREAAAQRFASLFEGIPVAAYGFDKNGRILIWNTAAEGMFDQSADLILGRPFWEVLAPPDQHDALRKFVHDVLSGEEYIGLEWVYGSPRGQMRRLMSNVFPLRDKDGVITGGISATVDITALKFAEKRLSRVVEGARCILWDATVAAVDDEQGGYRLHWDTRVQNEAAAQMVLPLHTSGDRAYMTEWLESRFIEDKIRMDKASTEKLWNGDSSYVQGVPLPRPLRDNTLAFGRCAY